LPVGIPRLLGVVLVTQNVTQVDHRLSVPGVELRTKESAEYLSGCRLWFRIHLEDLSYLVRQVGHGIRIFRSRGKFRTPVQNSDARLPGSEDQAEQLPANGRIPL
jgi:hypothetical protein